MARRSTFGTWGLAGLLYVAAIVIFVMAAFGADIGDFDRLDLIAWGLAAFAAAHIA